MRIASSAASKSSPGGSPELWHWILLANFTFEQAQIIYWCWIFLLPSEKAIQDHESMKQSLLILYIDLQFYLIGIICNFTSWCLLCKRAQQHLYLSVSPCQAAPTGFRKINEPLATNMFEPWFHIGNHVNFFLMGFFNYYNMMSCRPICWHQLKELLALCFEKLNSNGLLCLQFTICHDKNQMLIYRTVNCP